MSYTTKLFLTLLVLGASVHGEDYGSHRVRRAGNWNGVADVLLRHARQEILKQDKSRVPLPDVYESFKKKAGFIRLKGEFRATNGWLESFSSLARVGDVTVTTEGTSTIMTAVLGLSDLQLGYDHYEAKFWGNGPDGNLRGKIGKNAVRFIIKFDLVDGECKTTLTDVKVIEFDDFSINVSGLGSFDWLAEKVVEWMTNKRRDDIVDSIERQLREEIEKALQDFECDEYASLMIPI